MSWGLGNAGKADGMRATERWRKPPPPCNRADSGNESILVKGLWFLRMKQTLLRITDPLSSMSRFHYSRILLCCGFCGPRQGMVQLAFVAPRSASESASD